MIWTTAFWKGAAERAIRTIAQAFVAVLGANQVGILDVNWLESISVALMAGLLSIFTSVGNASFVAGSTTTDTEPSDIDDPDEEEVDDQDEDDDLVEFEDEDIDDEDEADLDFDHDAGDLGDDRPRYGVSGS